MGWRDNTAGNFCCLVDMLSAKGGVGWGGCSRDSKSQVCLAEVQEVYTLLECQSSPALEGEGPGAHYMSKVAGCTGA